MSFWNFFRRFKRATPSPQRTIGTGTTRTEFENGYIRTICVSFPGEQPESIMHSTAINYIVTEAARHITFSSEIDPKGNLIQIGRLHIFTPKKA